jgi:hypothetical protein
MGRKNRTNEKEGELMYVISWKARKKRQLGRPGRRWAININMDMRET